MANSVILSFRKHVWTSWFVAVIVESRTHTFGFIFLDLLRVRLIPKSKYMGFVQARCPLNDKNFIITH